MKRILSCLLVAVFVVCCVFTPLDAFKVSAQETNEPEFSWELSEIRLAEIYNEDNYENDFVPGEVIVGMKFTVAESRQIETTFPGLDVETIENNTLSVVDSVPEEAASESGLETLENSRATYTITLTANTKQSVLDAIEILKNDPDVAYAEPNYISQPASITPNDYHNYNLWGMSNIEAEDAWGITTGSSAVSVGVLDSGFDCEHEDLEDNIDRDSAYYVADGTYGDDADIGPSPYFEYGEYEHGTHVAGIIGAVGNNSTGVVGVNWDVTMVPIKICISNFESVLNNFSSEEKPTYTVKNRSFMVYPFIWGDVNEDGRATAIDATFIFR